MSGLLYKNFFLWKMEIIVIGVMQIICSVTNVLFAINNAGGNENAMMECMMMNVLVYFTMFYLVGIFDGGLFSNDEKRVTTCFIISTPKGAKSHVQSKYYALLIVYLAVLFFCFITDVICCVILGSVYYSCSGVLVFGFAFGILLTAFGVPFTIRFGSNHGGNIKLSTAGVLIMLVGVYFLFGDISFFNAENPMEVIMEYLTSGNAMLILSLVPLISILLYYVSYRISLALYKKGAENYD